MTESPVESFCQTMTDMVLTHAERMLAADLPKHLLKCIREACHREGIGGADRQWKVVGAALYLALAAYQAAEEDEQV